jgi:DNA-binding NtrC family response regulator
MNAKPRLLLVDDDPVHRRLLQARFQAAGYPVEVASAAEDALRTLKKADIDAVISDIHMPGMSGLDLLRNLGGRPPVILVSGALTHSTRNEVLAAGAADAFAKPIPWPDLFDAVSRAVGG